MQPKHRIDFHSFVQGAIFDTNNVDKQNAFHYAIEKINSLGYFNQHVLQPVVGYVPPNSPHQAILTACTLLSTGVAGIFGPSSLENSDAVRSLCDLKEIPQIDVHPDPQPMKGTNLNVYPSPAMLGRAYVEILKAWNWKTFAVLYEDDESLLRISEILKMRDNKDFRVVVRQLDKDKTQNYRYQV